MSKLLLADAVFAGHRSPERVRESAVTLQGKLCAVQRDQSEPHCKKSSDVRAELIAPPKALSEVSLDRGCLP